MILDAIDPEQRGEAIERAAAVVRKGQVVVLPTDTVYGIGCDAFDSVAVAAVLAAKHRGRDMPPPVLVAKEQTVQGLATEIPEYARLLMRRFWPGALTVVLKAQPSLTWDLGETNGTVAVRMPDDPVALALLGVVGPMAVTSANITGRPAATTAEQAQEQLGAAVALYLDGGERASAVASTIVDCTRAEPVILRLGAIPAADLQAVIGAMRLHESPEDYERAVAQDEEAAAAAEESKDDAAGAAAQTAGPTAFGSLRPSGLPIRAGARTEVAPPGA